MLQVKSTQSNSRSQQLRIVLESVIEESQILHLDESMLSLDVLILSLRNEEVWNPSFNLFEFLDNCIIRVARKPVNYHDAMSTLAATKSGIHGSSGANRLQLDLLLFGVIEQWQFLVERANTSTITNVAEWLLRYMELSSFRIRRCTSTEAYEEAMELLVAIRDQFRMNVKDKTCRSMFKKSLRDPPELGLSMGSLVDHCRAKEQEMEDDDLHVDKRPGFLQPESVPSEIPQEQENHFGLTKWAREDIQDAVTDGAIGELFLCLSSRYAEIRQQAVTGVFHFMGKLEVNPHVQFKGPGLTTSRHPKITNSSRCTWWLESSLRLRKRSCQMLLYLTSSQYLLHAF